MVRLPGEAPALPPPSPPGRLHGYAITGMATCALIGILALLASISVSWPADMSRYPIAVVIFCGIGFMAFASIAVFSAARDTYVHNGAERDEGSDD